MTNSVIRHVNIAAIQPILDKSKIHLDRIKSIWPTLNFNSPVNERKRAFFFEELEKYTILLDTLPSVLQNPPKEFVEEFPRVAKPQTTDVEVFVLYRRFLQVRKPADPMDYNELTLRGELGTQVETLFSTLDELIQLYQRLEGVAGREGVRESIRYELKTFEVSFSKPIPCLNLTITSLINTLIKAQSQLEFPNTNANMGFNTLPPLEKAIYEKLKGLTRYATDDERIVYAYEIFKEYLCRTNEEGKDVLSRFTLENFDTFLNKFAFYGRREYGATTIPNQASAIEMLKGVLAIKNNETNLLFSSEYFGDACAALKGGRRKKRKTRKARKTRKVRKN